VNHLLCTAIICGMTVPALAGVHSAHIDFENGWEGWNGTGSQIVPNGGNPGAHIHTQFTNFGTEYWTSTNQAFLGDYTKYSSVTLSIDVKVNKINFYGSPVERYLILDLRSISHGQDGYPWSSVWYNMGTLYAGLDWTTFSITLDPNAADMPAGWGGTGAEDPNTYMPKLPDNLTWLDIMQSVEQVNFSTYEPGWMYGLDTYFDVQIDNIRIEAVMLPAPGAALAMLGLAGCGAPRRRRAA
jgi:hypothetical protein